VLVANRGAGDLSREPSCADADPPRTVASEARPILSLCARGISLPVLIMPYASGVPYWHALLTWPIHHGDAFAMRRYDLLIGVLSLALLHALVRRLADDLTADVTALVLSVSSPFIILYSMLLQFEVTPWLLTMASALVALGRDKPSPRRMGLVGALLGLALVANVKAIFFVPPVAVVAWRTGALKGMSRGVVAAFVAAAVCVAPLLLANQLQGGHGIEGQASTRLALLLRPASLEELGSEALNLVRFAADTGSYVEAAWKPLGASGILAALVVGASAVFVVAAAVLFLLGRPVSPLAALSGMLLVLYVIVSLKLYDQRPAANYAPLQGVFGVMIALALTAGGRKLVRWGALGDARRATLALALPCLLCFAVNTIRRIGTADEVPLSTNAAAERRLVSWLESHPAPETTLYTSTYNLAGVLDSLGHGALTTVRLDRALWCEGRDADQTRCLADRWAAILAAPGVLPARIVVPAVETLTDERYAMFLDPALQQAIRGLGATSVVEAAFPLGGAPDKIALKLVRVERQARP
jgi:hypothetical protein